MSEQPTTLVYRTVGRAIEKCDYGADHEIVYVEVKRITPTGETRVHDNGYEKNLTELFVDAQGRTYHRHESIDYASNISYRRDEDGHGYRPLRDLGRTAARDLTGRPITLGWTGATCPPGPPWSRELAEAEAARVAQQRRRR